MNNSSPSDITRSKTRRDGALFDNKDKLDVNLPIGNEEGIILSLYGTSLYGAGYKMVGGIMVAAGVLGFVINYI